MAERRTLMAKGELSKTEKSQLNKIDKELQQYPTGENQEEMNSRKYISELYKKIQSGQIKIEE